MTELPQEEETRVVLRVALLMLAMQGLGMARDPTTALALRLCARIAECPEVFAGGGQAAFIAFAQQETPLPARRHRGPPRLICNPFATA